MRGIGQSGEDTQLSGQERLFLSLAEQLSRPFMQLGSMAELAKHSNGSDIEAWRRVEVIAKASLRLTESYALSLRLHGTVTPLEIEPVAVSSLLYDAAEELEPFAKQYGVNLELDTGPRLQPLLTNRMVLQSVLTSLGHVFVLAQAELDTPGRVRLAAHRSRYGIVAGLYGNDIELASDSLRRARALHGRAREPLQRLVGGPAAGVFVADSLLETVASRLHIARYHTLTGLAATLPPSQQLQLV